MMEYRYLFEVSASQDDMDAWEDGRKFKFTMKTDSPIINYDDLDEIVTQYLKSIGFEHRSSMYHVSEIKNK